MGTLQVANGCSIELYTVRMQFLIKLMLISLFWTFCIIPIQQKKYIVTYSQREILNKDEVTDLKRKIKEKCQCKIGSVDSKHAINALVVINPKMKYPTDLRHI